MVMVIKQSLGSWSLLWSLKSYIVVVVVLLFSVLVQGLTKVSDQSRALEDRNDSNNSLEVYTHLNPLFTSFTTVRIWM